MGQNVGANDNLNNGPALHEDDKLAPVGRADRNRQLAFTPGYPHLRVTEGFVMLPMEMRLSFANFMGGGRD